MSRIIIGIHGLGNKPEKKLLEKWWKQSITDGLKKIDKFKFEPKFEIVYWADILNDKPLNIIIRDKENPYYLDEPYTAAVENLDISTGKEVLAMVKTNEVMLAES